MNYFEQVIFPPILKTSKVVLDLYIFEYWIVGTNSKELWVKCPICNETYRSTTLHMSEEMMKKYIKEYKSFHYRKVIKECPSKAKHPEESWETILSK